METESALLNLLFTTLRQTRNANYCDVVCTTVLIYDTLLNLDAEVKFVWCTRWSLPKVLYLISRYYGPIHLSILLSFDIAYGLTIPDCHAWMWMQTVLGPLVFSAVINTILILRVHAIYNRDKKLLILMCVMMSCLFATELVAEIWTLIATPIVSPPAGIPWPGCLATTTSTSRQITLVAWVPSIVVGFVCVGLTLYKYISLAGVKWRRNKRMSPLLIQFVWDGTIYFFLLLAADLYGALMTLEVNNPLARTGLTSLVVVYSLAGTRFVINLRIEAMNAVHVSGLTTEESTVYESIELRSTGHRQQHPGLLAEVYGDQCLVTSSSRTHTS